MERRELEQFLHEYIPLSKAMGVQVRKSNAEHVVLSTPLIPNRNHQSTVFGGSASAVAILAAWERFQEMLKRKQRARISIKVTICCHGENVGEMRGEFVALASPARAG